MFIKKMSLNFDKIGKPVCKIIGNGRMKNKVVYVDTKDEIKDEDSFKSIDLRNNDKFMLVPDDSERMAIAIFGPAGSGKSYFSSKFIREYKKKHKDNPVYVISNCSEDPVIDEIPNIKRIDIESSLYEDPIDYNLFENSLVLFDDHLSIADKKIKDALVRLQNEILECGRKKHISCICISHTAAAGNETKKILNECSNIVIFPHSGANKNLQYMLENYAGVDKKQMKDIKKMKTRWACICKHYPMLCITEQKVFLLNQDENESGSDSEEDQIYSYPPSAYKKKK